MAFGVGLGDERVNIVYRITDFITEAYFAAWDYMRRWLFDEFWLLGGRGSGKSTVAARRIIDDIIHDRTANWVCYKRYQVDIEGSVYAECIKAINRSGLGVLFDCKTSPHEITYTPTGQKILFRGLDKGAQSKGLTVIVGYIHGAWFEEADQFKSQKEIDTVLQSIGRGGEHFQVIYTYNPPENKAHWINVEAAKHNPNRYILHTTYKDWKAEWLGGFFFRKMKAIRADGEAGELRYKHEYLGIPTGNGNEIFKNIHGVVFTPEQVAEMRSKRYGMDFGQSDPTTLVGTNYIPRLEKNDRGVMEDIGGTLQIFTDWFKTDALTREVYAELKRRELLNTIIKGDPGGGGKTVLHDLRDMGARFLKQAYKPAGSVEKGVTWIRQCQRVEIDTVAAPNAFREFSGYCFDQLRDGTNRNEYPDLDNHTIDGTRYSREEDIFKSVGSRLLI